MSQFPPSWRRVHPLALMFFFMGLLRSTAQQGMSLLPVVVLLALNEQVRALALPWGLLAVVVLLLITTGLRYLFFRFQVAADRIHVKQGILQRRELTLEFSHIQQADVRVPWYYRAFGLANLSLDSVGARQDAVVLSGLRRNQAETLRNTILHFAGTAPEQSAETAEDFRLHLGFTDILRYGLMHNALLILLPLIFPVLNQVLTVIEQQLTVRWAELTPDWLTDSVTNGAAGLTLLVPLLLLLVFVVVAVSVVAGVVRYHGYTLTRQGDRWQYTAGLLSLTTRSVRVPRIQLLVFRQSWMGRLLRRQSLIVSKAGEAIAESESSGRFVVPVLSPAQQQALSAQLNLPETAEWQSVGWGYAVLHWLQWTLIVAFLGFVFMGPALLTHWQWVVPASLTLLALVQWQRWRRLRVHRSEAWIALRKGFWGEQAHWLPLARVQTLQVQQSLWQRSCDRATLVVTSAGGHVTLPWLPHALAEQWRDELLLSTAQRHSESL